MIITRRSGAYYARHQDGRMGRVVHPFGPVENDLIYVYVNERCTANWARRDCTFRWIPAGHFWAPR